MKRISHRICAFIFETNRKLEINWNFYYSDPTNKLEEEKEFLKLFCVVFIMFFLYNRLLKACSEIQQLVN